MENTCPNCLAEINGDITHCSECGELLGNGFGSGAADGVRQLAWETSDVQDDDEDIVLDDFSAGEFCSATDEITLEPFEDEPLGIAPLEQPPARQVIAPSPPAGGASRGVDQASRDESGLVIWLTEVAARVREAYREMTVAASVCLLGVLVWLAPYHRAAGGLLIGAGLLGIAYLLLLAPRRIDPCTPIHAVQAYFQALGHYLPDYARMYALLTSTARKSAEFVSYGGFRAYWRYQLCRLKPPGYSVWPVECRVDQFKLESTADPDRTAVSFRLQFYLRGRSDQLLRSLAMRASAVRGPDDRWYLNDGKLVDLGDLASSD